jgi:hypothetical protein
LLQVLDSSGEVASRFEDFGIAAVSTTQALCGSGNRSESVEGPSKLPICGNVIAACGRDPSEPDARVGSGGTLGDSRRHIQRFACQASSLVCVGGNKGELTQAQQDLGLLGLDTGLLEDSQ